MDSGEHAPTPSVPSEAGFLPGKVHLVRTPHFPTLDLINTVSIGARDMVLPPLPSQSDPYQMTLHVQINGVTVVLASGEEINERSPVVDSDKLNRDATGVKLSGEIIGAQLNVPLGQAPNPLDVPQAFVGYVALQRGGGLRQLVGDFWLQLFPPAHKPGSRDDELVVSPLSDELF